MYKNKTIIMIETKLAYTNFKLAKFKKIGNKQAIEKWDNRRSVLEEILEDSKY